MTYLNAPTTSPTTEQHPRRLRELDEEECWSRLRGRDVGHLAYVEGDGPVILPLNYLVRDATIWFRTASYNQLAVHVTGQQVAFEVDDIDMRDHTGWSVLVRGRVEHVLDAGGADRPAPVPWAEGTRTMTFCLAPTQVTGRVLLGDEVSPAPGHGPGTVQRDRPRAGD